MAFVETVMDPLDRKVLVQVGQDIMAQEFPGR
jgi:hypothetical protein